MCLTGAVCWNGVEREASYSHQDDISLRANTIGAWKLSTRLSLFALLLRRPQLSQTRLPFRAATPHCIALRIWGYGSLFDTPMRRL